MKLFKDAYAQEYSKAGITTTEIPFVSGDFRGVEIHGIGGLRFVSRMFFVQSRFYFVTAAARNVVGFDSQIALLNTFRILKKAEWSAALVSENTPPALPQIQSPQNASPDAKEEGLIGKVREVITENEVGKSIRETEEHTFYAENGYKTESVIFEKGYPMEIVVFGWIDGMRVSNSYYVEYGSDEGPNDNGIVNLITLGAPDSTKAVIKRDERFSERYAVQYDSDGRLIQKATYQNDGSLSSRVVITFMPNQREKTVFDGSGKLNSRTVEILDASGTIVEERNYDNEGKLEKTLAFEFKNDVHGNWIERKASTKTMTSGKSILKPFATLYRKITYYD
jgi:YD repeat-containing protein